ncbi:MAG: tetratricopeptide repeat protein, partial [Bdellovibrionaceae bacterium]|nr:tetratricopeptide repeat protein [Bdellovibrio sp.]
MKNSATQWVIKLQTDQVKGPYSTEAVTKMITNGIFSGIEEISAYPEGEWQALTKQPEFYEALLESLENPIDVDNKKSQKMEAETVVRITKKDSFEPTSPQLNDDIKKLLEDGREVQRKAPPKQSKQAELYSLAKQNQALATQAMMQARDKNLTINLSDIKSVQNKEIKRFIPFILIILTLVAAALYLGLSGESARPLGWTLTAPQKNGTPLTENEIKEKKRKIVRAFQSGQMDLILQEHRNLAKAIEGAPKDLEAMGLLCVAYELLWPFTKQTVQDLKSISIVTQWSRAVNPISNYSDSCQVVYLIAKGQGREARSLLERTLDHPVDDHFSLGPFLYLMKGEMLELEHNYINSAAYYEQASRLWPQWLTARFGQARMIYKQGKFNEALGAFQEMFNLDKDSKAALYGLALVEQKGFKNQDKAYNLFSTGYKIKQTLQKDFHIEALLTYAQLLIDKGESAKALEVAQVGYQLNPSHRGLKEIVLSLGGNDRVDNIQSEIILLGDHFARSGDHLAAQAQYKAAFDLDPKNANAAYKAAKSLWQLNQTREAIVWTEKALKADPQMVSAAILKADYESQKYNFIEAAKTLQEVSRRNPQNHEILKGQALLEFRKNNITGAIQYGERAVKIYDADVELLSLLAQAHILFYLNSPATKKEAIDKRTASLDAAQAYAGKAIDLEPSWPEAQITYAKFLAAKDGPVRGERYLKELV